MILELARKAAPKHAEPPIDRVRIDPKGLGDLGSRETVDFGQQEQLAILERKAVEDAIDRQHRVDALMIPACGERPSNVSESVLSSRSSSRRPAMIARDASRNGI